MRGVTVSVMPVATYCALLTTLSLPVLMLEDCTGTWVPTVIVAVALLRTSSDGAASERTSVTSSSAAMVACTKVVPSPSGRVIRERKLNPPDASDPLPNAMVSM